jgi:hypothetical protein
VTEIVGLVVLRCSSGWGEFSGEELMETISASPGIDCSRPGAIVSESRDLVADVSPLDARVLLIGSGTDRRGVGGEDRTRWY